MKKRAESLGSALPDQVKSSDTVSPLPVPVVENKTAPGRWGPKGLSPRTSYSRVNVGQPPAPDLSSQKSAPPGGLQFLPSKTAEAEDFMYTMARQPTLNQMLKAAMAGTISKVSIADEAARQFARTTGQELEKDASIDPSIPHFSTEYVQKLANAVGYTAVLLKQADQGNIQMPGVGPGTLGVLEAESDEENIDAGQGGQAIPADLPPMNPPLQKEEVQTGKAQTGLLTNDEMMHEEQPRDPWSNERTTLQNAASKQPDPTPAKTAEVLYWTNLERLGLIDEQTKEAKVMETLRGVGRRAKELYTGSKLKALKSKVVAGRQYAEPGKGMYEKPYRKELAKVIGTYGGTAAGAGAAGYGGYRAMRKKSSAKEAGLKEIGAGIKSMAGRAGSRAKELYTGSRLKAYKTYAEAGKRMGVEKNPFTGPYRKELAKVVGAYGAPAAAAGAVGYGAMRKKSSAFDKEAGLKEIAGKAGRRAKELFTASKARTYRKAVQKGGLMKEVYKKPYRKELAKVVGAYGAAGAGLGGAGYGGYRALKKKGSAPMAMIRKFAEDAIYPANIQSEHFEIPPVATASEVGQVSVPSDVRSQQRLVGSNEAAINYTKGQAKADPKSDLNKILEQPALSSAHDKILQKTLDHTGEAGVKISMAQNAHRAAAARVVLSDMIEKVAAARGKEKNSQGGISGQPGMFTPVTPPTVGRTPSAATGVPVITPNLAR